MKCSVGSSGSICRCRVWNVVLVVVVASVDLECEMCVGSSGSVSRSRV